MSIYTECRDAARTLLDSPHIKGLYTNREGVFTELDVILLASTESSGGGYSEAEMREAHREASQVMGGLFRSRQAVRFGPVSLKALGLDEPDYARLAAKIIYSSPEHGPDVLKTPNGDFPRMFVQDDTITRSGRRLGANRDDFTPWPEQDIMGQVGHPDDQKPMTPEQREAHRLKSECDSLRRRLTEAHTEINRLRDVIAAERVTRPEVEALAERIDQLESKF